MTLRELCETYGVSRRAVQGYEELGLVQASGKNERGYLLYDAKTQRQVCLIKTLQRIGFQLKEIRPYLEASDSEKITALTSKLECLEQEKAELEIVIRMTYEMINDMKKNV